jgi:hypothetical protein
LQRFPASRDQKAAGRRDGEQRAAIARPRRAGQTDNGLAPRREQPDKAVGIGGKPRVTSREREHGPGWPLDLEGLGEKIDAKMIRQRAIENLFVHEAFPQQRGVRGDALASRQNGGVLQQRHWNAEAGEKGDLRRQGARRGVLQPNSPAKSQAHRSGKRLHAAPVEAASLFPHSRGGGR